MSKIACISAPVASLRLIGLEKGDYERTAHSWRTLARSFEFQRALARFIAFNKSRESKPALVSDMRPGRGPEFEIDLEDARHAILLFHELAISPARPGLCKLGME